MPDTWALPKLYADVVSRFALEGLNVPNVFGWREPAKKTVPGNRIVWIPGDPNGDMGEILSARYPGRNPRPLATLYELFTVEITAIDAESAENELAQYLAARDLFDRWYRAVFLAAYGTFRMVSNEWVTDKKERRAGAAIRVVASIEAMIPDAALPIAEATTGVDLDVDELDVSESLQVSP